MKFESVSRRAFLKGTGITTSSLFAYSVVGASSAEAQAIDSTDIISPELFLTIDGDQFKLVLPRSEMGQDVVTSFSMIVAEEMDFPCERIVIQFADADSALGGQLTVGSASIGLWWNKMRQLGAYVRASVLAQAASRFAAKPEDCVIDRGIIRHRGSHLKADYIELLKSGTLSSYQGVVVLKSPQKYSLVGHYVKSANIRDKVNGSFKYVGDLADRDTVKAAVVAYRRGWPLPSAADLGLLSAKNNLIDVFQLDGELSGFTTRIVLLAKETWPLLKSKRALDTQLEEGLSRIAGSTTASAFDHEYDRLNVDPIITRDRLKLSFSTPAVAHAPMEPESALVRFSEDKCEIWAPTQAPQDAKKQVASFLKLDMDYVVVHTFPMGGSFGRKRYSDFVIETAWIAQAHFNRQRQKNEVEPRKSWVKVQLVWTREDDFAREHYRPESVQQLTWGSEQQDHIEHILCESASPAHQNSTTAGVSLDFLDWDFHSTKKTMAGDFLPGIWRAVEHGYLGFAINSFIDELSYCRGEDPIAFFSRHIRQLSLIERVKVNMNAGIRYQPARMLKVVETVKRQSKWDSSEQTEGSMGFAAYRVFGSYIAIVAQITLDNDSLTVSRIWASVDCGVAVNPDGLKAQIEGGIIFGLSACLLSEIYRKQDKMSLNFHRFPVTRIRNAPQIDVFLENTHWSPSGAGELGVAAIAPAVANAVRRATNLRFVRLPMLKKGRLNTDHAVPGYNPV